MGFNLGFKGLSEIMGVNINIAAISQNKIHASDLLLS